MNKNKATFLLFLALPILFGLSSCKKESKAEKVRTKTESQGKNRRGKIDIPVGKEGEGVKSFFDDTVGEFFLEDDKETVAPDTIELDADTPILDLSGDQAERGGIQDISWEDETPEDDFKTIYFDFDGRGIRPDQQDALEYNVKKAKKMSKDKKIVIEGHACHSAGSRTYNLAISDDRAKCIKDEFGDAGIEIVSIGRGSEMPTVKGGERAEQWPNRRVEVYAQLVN